MEPQQYQPTPVINQKSSKTGLGLLFALLTILICLGLSGFLFTTLQSTKKDLNSANTQLDQTKKEKEELEAKLKPFRDSLRKKDLALLAIVINDYKATHGGRYYTTEGRESLRIYENELSPLIKDFNDPSSGKRYGYEGIAPVHTPSPLELGVIQYQWLGKCAPDGDFEDTSDESFAAIRTVLESGATHCVNL